MNVLVLSASECNTTFVVVVGWAGCLHAHHMYVHTFSVCTTHTFVKTMCRYLQQRGWDVTYLPVEKDGRIHLGQLQESIRPDTALVSVMAVNNEIGE